MCGRSRCVGDRQFGPNVERIVRPEWFSIDAAEVRREKWVNV